MFSGVRLRPLLYGAATFIPGVTNLFKTTIGGSDSARYCYSVWLRHLRLARKNGLSGVPGAVAELGPGESLGTGLAALLSGAQTYFAFDVVRHADIGRNLLVFDQLVELFSSKAAIPDNKEFPLLRPFLADYAFPRDILTDECLTHSLNPMRLSHIRSSITGEAMLDSTVRYMVPWQSAAKYAGPIIDLFMSQAVLQHVDNIECAYQTMRDWLKPGGMVTHTYDFSSMRMTRSWDGHWAVPEITWKILRGHRPYLINRLPFSAHLEMLQASGMAILDKITYAPSIGNGVPKLAKKFQSMSMADRNTSAAFLVARLDTTQPSSLS